MRRLICFLGSVLLLCSAVFICGAGQAESPMKAEEAFGEDWLKQVEALQKAGQSDQATQFLLGVIQNAPNSKQAFGAEQKLIRLYLEIKQVESADAVCQQWLTEYPDNPLLPASAYDIAMAYREANETERYHQLFDYIQDRWFDTEWAIHCQRDMIHEQVENKDTRAAQAALDVLLTRYATHKDIAGTIYNLGKYYKNMGDQAKTLQLHQYNVEHYSKELQGMYSQVEIVKMLMADDEKQTETDEAVNTLATTFVNQPGLAKELYQVARKYQDLNRSDRALQVDQYNTQQFSSDLYGACSAVCAELDLQSEGTSKQDALDRLNPFLEHKDLPKVLYTLGTNYLKQKKPAQALATLGYNSKNLAKAEGKYALWSQTEIIKYHIRGGNEPAAQIAVQTLMRDYDDQSTLYREITRIGDTYVQAGMLDPAAELYAYVQTRWTKKEESFWAKVGQVHLAVARGNHKAVEDSINAFLSGFQDQADLSEAIFAIGESYWRAYASQEDADQKHLALKHTLGVWERVIQECPPSATRCQSLQMSANCLMRLNQPDKALTYLEAVVNDDQGYDLAWQAPLLMAKIFKIQMKQGQLSKDETDARLCTTWKLMLAKYPGCPLASMASQWLAKNDSKQKGGVL